MKVSSFHNLVFVSEPHCSDVHFCNPSPTFKSANLSVRFIKGIVCKNLEVEKTFFIPKSYRLKLHILKDQANHPKKVIKKLVWSYDGQS